jgi:glycosyltransferase involved in cell wall biosynthesis
MTNTTQNTPRLTIVASHFHPKIGGLENYCYNLAKRFHESGEYVVNVITTNYESKGYRKDIVDGMIVHRLPVSFRISNTPINLGWYGMIRHIFKEEPPTIINTHSPVPFLVDVAVLAAKTVPSVVTYHAGSMKKGNAWFLDLIIGAYEGIFLGALFRRAAAIVAISQAFARKEFPQYAAKTYFIPTGVDLACFKATPLPQEETVTFVGRMEHSSAWKGVGELLQAMAMIVKERPQSKLALVGGGDALDHYKNQAADLGITNSVIFHGPLRGDDLIAAFQKASVIVLPSQSDSEAFSVTLVEGMASGRPLVATNIGGNPQVVEDGKNGLLVAAKSPKALADGILRVLRDRVLAERLALDGSGRAKSMYSWDVQVAKYCTLFNTLK